MPKLRSRCVRAARKRVWGIVRRFLLPFTNLLYWLESRERSGGTPLSAGATANKAGRNSRGEADAPLIVCVVAGPNDGLGIQDLLDSARFYLGHSYRVIVVDDSGGIEIWRLTRKYPEVDYLRNWRLRGIKGLDNSLRRAFSHSVRNHRFHAVLRIDTDALITGYGLREDILGYLMAHPRAGMLGSYRETCTGSQRNFLPIAQQFERNLGYWGPLIAKATNNGYVLGEHAQGGAYVLSAGCLTEMASEGLLTPRAGKGTFVSEDGIFSLYVRALGYEIHDFARNGPLAVAWQGLPLVKEEIVAQDKKVIHSVKYTSEDLRIRDYFRQRRTQSHGCYPKGPLNSQYSLSS